MNVFTTDHPLWSDPPPSRARSALTSVLAVAIILCPFVLAFFWIMNLTGDLDTTDYTPDPFWEVLVGATVDSLIVACVVVALYRLAACILREVWYGLKPGGRPS